MKRPPPVEAPVLPPSIVAEPCPACVEAAAKALNFDRAVPSEDEDLRGGRVLVTKSALHEAAVFLARRECPHTLPLPSFVAKTLELPRVVYFLAEGRAVVRIGASWTPLRRVQALKEDYPRELRLLGLVTKYEIEDVWDYFKPEHIYGEWFRFTDELLAFVDEHHDDDYDPEAEVALLRRREALVDHERARILGRLTAYERGLLGVSLHTKDALEAALVDDEAEGLDQTLRGKAQAAAKRKAGQKPIVRKKT